MSGTFRQLHWCQLIGLRCHEGSELVAAAAIALGENPLLLCIPATMAASCAFMLPPATPPNAIVFGSGYVSIPQMSRAGFLINFTAIGILFLSSFIVVTRVFGITLGEIPIWVTK